MRDDIGLALRRNKGIALRDQQTRKADAARAMLAALKLHMDEISKSASVVGGYDYQDRMRAAIAQAEAAGLTTEGN